ncbi:hypothetical protein Avbf_12836, partial [Armadillidium vulgare]
FGEIVETYTLGDDDSETLLPCQTYNIRLRASNEMVSGLLRLLGQVRRRRIVSAQCSGQCRGEANTRDDGHLYET